MGLASYEIWIYDSWGNTVWYSNKLNDMGSPAEGWDGKAKGEPMPAECYIWKIEARFLTGQPWKGKKTSNDTYVQFGNLMLLR